MDKTVDCGSIAVGSIPTGGTRFTAPSLLKRGKQGEFNNETIEQSNNELKAVDFIDQSLDHGYRTYGFLVHISPQSQIQVKVEYNLHFLVCDGRCAAPG